MTPSELVQALERHTQLTYTDYEYDGEEELPVEKIKNLHDILNHLDRQKAHYEEKLAEFVQIIRRHAERGIDNGSLAVLKDTQLKDVTIQGSLYFLQGAATLDGTITLLKPNLDTPPDGSDKPQDGSESAQTPITPLGDNAAGSRSDGWAGEHEDAPWGQEAE